jgi:hypothetical protein
MFFPGELKFRLMTWDDYFDSPLWTFEAVVKIGLILKSNLIGKLA